MLISHLDFRIEASLRYVHSLEPGTDFFDHLSNFFKNIEIEVAIAAPLSLMEGGPAESDSSLLDVTSSLIILRLKSHLLLLLSTWIIRIDLLVFELGMKLVDPLIVNPEQHYRVGVPVVVIVALKLGQVHLVHECSSVCSENGSRLLMDAAHNYCLLHTF